MAPRSFWKGYLKLSLVTCPVAMSPAISQEDKFSGIDWTPSAQHGDPHLAGCIGWIDCAVHNVHAEGDHYIVVGRVLDLVEGEADDPLLFYRSAYRKLD